MSYIYKHYKDKYEIVLAGAGQYNHNPDFKRFPWEIKGVMPIDQPTQERMKVDPVLQQKAVYGELTIDLIVQDVKPDIILGIEDSWGCSFLKNFEFSKHIPVIHHVTIDSLPILDQAYDVAKSTKYYWTWAEFAAKRMREKQEYSHVISQYPCIDVDKFFPLPPHKKKEIRTRFNIPENATIFGFVFRNQPRKLVNKLIEGFSLFKKNNPDKKAFLLLVTSFHEGWNIPKFIEDYGVNREEVLCTYVCRATKEYYLGPFQGEGLDNTILGHQKSMFTVDVTNGVSEEQLNEIYNVIDLYTHCVTSGGCELPVCEAALSGAPVAIPNYACMEDVVDLNKGSFSIPFDFYTEPNTQFLKANPRPDGIAKIMQDFCKLSKKQKEEMSKSSREWALKNYDVKVNAEKILKKIDEIPQHNWDFKIKLEGRTKNIDYPFPTNIKSDVDFILDLYKNILYSYEETEETKGCLDWQASLKNGVSRQQVYDFFIDVAKKENKSLSNNPQTFADLLQETGNKRLLFVLKESAGDIFNSTSLLPSLKAQYPNHDVYYACDVKYASILLGNPNIFAILPYDPVMENEIHMIGAGGHKGWFDVYIHAGVSCQRQLNYLSHKNLALELK